MKMLVPVFLALGLAACSAAEREAFWNYPIGPVMDENYYRSKAAALDYELERNRQEIRRLEYKLERMRRH